MDQRAAKRTGATIPNCPSQSVVLKAAARRFVLCCAARLNAWCCIVTCRHAGMPGRQYVCSPAFACVLTVCLQLHSGPAATPPPSMRTVIMVLNYSNKHKRNGFPDRTSIILPSIIIMPALRWATLSVRETSAAPFSTCPTSTSRAPDPSSSEMVAPVAHRASGKAARSGYGKRTC